MFLLPSALILAMSYGPDLDGSLPSPETWEEGIDSSDTGLGGCSGQLLANGVQLPNQPDLYFRMQPDHTWGTAEMIDLIVAAGWSMELTMPEASPFLIGDISSHHGGALYGHRSHRGGVDADIGIYRRGGVQSANEFVDLTPADLDLRATWTLMDSMLQSGMVDYILLDQSHIRALKAYTVRTHQLTAFEADQIFPEPNTPGLWERTGIVRHAPSHRDHMHVRVLCPDGTKAH